MMKWLSGLVAALVACQVFAVEPAAKSAGKTEAEWMTDLPKALAKAKQDNKHVLLDFTGSDWCGWCIKLKKEVFSKPEFAEYAAKNLVLVEVDFPRFKKLPSDQKKANDALSEKYDIEGFPTIIVLDKDGKKVGKTGYLPGGPKAFIADLEKMK